MAAAIIPLVSALAPEIINLIVGLVHKSAPAAESQLGAATGPAKFGMVFGDVVAALNKAAVAGQISKTLPADETIQVIIQAAVQSMQLSGLLGAALPATAAVTANQPQPLFAGSGYVVVMSGQ